MTEITFEHDGTTYAAFTPEAALAAGVPQAVIDTALAGLRREAIKAECRRRIYSTASAESQMNINGAAVIIGNKPAGDRTENDEAVLAGFGSALKWIEDMRAAVESLTLDTEADILADESWPACPPAVLALIQRF